MGLNRIWSSRPVQAITFIAGLLLIQWVDGATQLSSPPHFTARPGTVSGYQTAGEFVAFMMLNSSRGSYEIYSRRIDGSGPVHRMTDGASTTYGIDEYAISPDGLYVAYEARGLSQSTVELYGRRTDGTGTPVRLTSSGEPSRFQPIFRFLPNTAHDLVWLWGGSTTESDRLYAVPADGSAPQHQISPVFPTNAWDINHFRLTVRGSRVVYHAIVNGTIELYSSNPATPTGSPLKINPTNFYDYSHFTYDTTPDERRVIWTDSAAQSESPLMSRPLDASVPAVQIGAYGPNTGRQPFEVSRDSARAAYTSNVLNLEVNRLYSTPVDGSAQPQKLTDWDVNTFAFTPDSSRLVYVADIDNYAPIARPYSLFSRDVLAATAEKELYRGTSPITRYAPVNNRVLFFGSSAALWSVPADGSAPASEFARLSSGTIVDFVLSPDEQYAILPVNTDGDTEIEALYATRTDGSTAPWQVSHNLLGTSASIINYGFAPDSRTLLYQASDATTSGFELFATQLPEPAIGVLCTGILLVLATRRHR